MADPSSGQPAPEADDVRRALLRFSGLVQRLENEGLLLRSLPFLLGQLGDLRRLIFDYEVRVTERLLPIEDPVERESRRVVREAEERARELLEEWSEPPRPDEEDGA